MTRPARLNTSRPGDVEHGAGAERALVAAQPRDERRDLVDRAGAAHRDFLRKHILHVLRASTASKSPSRSRRA